MSSWIWNEVLDMKWSVGYEMRYICGMMWSKADKRNREVSVGGVKYKFL